MCPRFYLETYGCSLNSADSDIIAGRLIRTGATRVATLEDADVIVLNTCGVKEPTENRIIHRLEQLSGGQKPVIVTGCLPKISFKRVQTAIPDFAAVIGPQSILSIEGIFGRVIAGERGIVSFVPDSESKLKFFQGPPGSVICTVPICEGCLGTCSYCAVRLARSSLKSYLIDEIVETVQRCIHLGYREIRLTAQDAGAFGHDTGEHLVDLLRSLDSLVGEHRFRLGMFNPNLVIDYVDELAKTMCSNHFFRFFHVPLQSGSDTILKKMSRSYSLSEWSHVVTRLREQVEHATLATDVIVGFPTERDIDFDMTVAIVEKIRPDIVNISKYGDRPGTLASRSDGKVDTLVKKERSRRLSLIVDRLALENNRRWTDRTDSVLISEVNPLGGVIGRNRSYKLVMINQGLKLGTTVNVRIVDADRTHLVGCV